ncbi:MAG TPA: tyrosine--tRNA ligase, partial [Clostridiales bacterium]|nr:tyrosine--tRNA ligase [Clostridiales bacterium]
MTNIFDELKERGLIKQTVYEDDLKKLLNEENINFYVGFDPTADSLHVGHFTTLMMASRLQKAGHKPYVLIGGGTAMIGDPSGRSDMRPMMTRETIEHNVECFKKQMAKFLSFEGENGAVIVDNADWLLKLNY